jgi:hypothetical protein
MRDSHASPLRSVPPVSARLGLRSACWLLAAILCAALFATISPSDLHGDIVRGDANGDAIVDIADPVETLGYLFGGGSALCLDAADSNDDGEVDVADPVRTLGYLFSGGPAPPPPFPGCGDDTTPDTFGCTAWPLACGPPIDFSLPVHHPVDAGPVQSTTGDFDGNGTLDLVVVCGSSATASVLLGDGAGGFTAGPSLAMASTPVGNTPYDVASGHFDVDGLLDLVFAAGTSLQVRFGIGGGEFGPAATLSLAFSATAVEAADFDGDGDLDLAAALAFSPTVSVFLGDGAGTFAPAPSSPAISAMAMTTGDFDGDGVLDIALSTAIAAPNLAILLGTGTGTFVIGDTHHLVGAFVVGISAADLDADGALDLVAASSFTGGGPGARLSILYGDGAGGFGEEQNLLLGTSFAAVTTADLDGDGAIDIAAPATFLGSVEVLLGSGTGEFAAPLSFATGRVSPSVSAADFDGDGALDLVTANGQIADVSVLLQEP